MLKTPQADTSRSAVLHNLSESQATSPAVEPASAWRRTQNKLLVKLVDRNLHFIEVMSCKVG